MNRTITNVLFGGIGSTATQSDYKIEGQITKTTVDDTVDALNNADSVILVCIQICRLSTRLEISIFRLLVTVWLLPKPNMRLRRSSARCGPRASKCALRSTLSPEGALRLPFSHGIIADHASNRMPGQCNVLLAEASVPYDSASIIIHQYTIF